MVSEQVEYDLAARTDHGKTLCLCRSIVRMSVRYGGPRGLFTGRVTGYVETTFTVFRLIRPEYKQIYPDLYPRDGYTIGNNRI